MTGTDFEAGEISWKTCYHISCERFAEDPNIHLRRGDLLITKDGSIGKVAVVKNIPGPATLNSGIFLTRPLHSAYLADYLYYVLVSRVFSDFFDYVASGATIQYLYQNVFVDFSYPAPPLAEQRAIADFLDHETARINSLITRKLQIIELIEERRIAEVAFAATHGISPGLPMKHSGINWIEKVPAHWRCLPLRHVAESIQTGPFGSQLHSEEYVDNGTPVINPSA